MEENQYNLGIRPMEGDAWPSGIAYIAIPSDIDRNKYISECYSTSTVSIFSEHNGFSNRVPIDRFSLNFIQFPNKVNEFCSAVSFLLDPIHKNPIVVGLFNRNDEYCDLVENQFKFRRELNGNSVEIVGSPDGKYLALNVSADKAGEISLNVSSKDNSAKLTVDIDGDIDIMASNGTTIRQHHKFEVVTSDPDNETQLSVFQQEANSQSLSSDSLLIHTGEFRINDGKENIVLGQVFKKLLDELIDEISNITVSTALGRQPILNKLQIASFKDRTDTILSKVGFIDE